MRRKRHAGRVRSSVNLPVRTAKRPVAFMADLIEQLATSLLKRFSFVLDYVPNDGCADSKILMDENIVDAHNFSPFDFD
jgi:hypothetical protein